MKTRVRGIVLSLIVTLLLGTSSTTQAQIRANVAFNLGGTRQFVVLPTYYYPASLRRRDDYPRYYSNPSVGETWLVRLGSPRGVQTKTYQVNNSRDAILRARREFPNLRLLSVKKSYR